MQIQHIYPAHAVSGESELVSKAAVVSSLTMSYTVSPTLLQRFKNCHKILITSELQLMNKQTGI